MAIPRERIREIDISKQAHALRFLRFTDYLLVIVCGSWLLNIVALPFVDPGIGQDGDLIFALAAIAVLIFTVYTGSRHVGVIDVRVWRAHLIAFPLLLVFCIFTTASAVFTSFANNEAINLDDFQTINGVMTMFWLAGGATIGFVAVVLLRRMRTETFGVPLVELLNDLAGHRGQRAIDVTKIERVNTPRGTVIAVFGGMILLGTALAPLPNDWSMARSFVQMSQQISLLGYFLLIRARRYFQVRADSLLAVDKRSPILFLRSFEDDEKIKFSNSALALLDFSLETRLSNHFTYFGPFIAIGSPKDTVPVPGAARVVLSNTQWQPKVENWMAEASVIVMYSGKTQWVNWELARLIRTGQVPKLILMIPEIKGWRSATRAKDINTRIEYMKEAFKNTKWIGALTAFENYQDVRAMLFRSDGSLIAIKSRPRNRDSYHLAALIAHYILLDDQPRVMLLGIRGPFQGKRLPMDKQVLRVGSASNNDVVIKGDAYVSRLHASLSYEEDALFITDQGSTNGTFINGNLLRDSAVRLNSGDKIRVGHSIFEVAYAESKDRPKVAVAYESDQIACANT